MRRDFTIRSQLAPEAIVAALEARRRQWRESQIPATLREQGTYGIRIRIKGNRIRMEAERMFTDRRELRCTADIAADPQGSVVRARIRQPNPLLWLCAAGGAVVLFRFWSDPGVDSFAILAAVAVWGFVLSLIHLALGNSVRHDVEAEEFEKILRAAARSDPALTATSE
jgi:hypothetical protein